jgi:HEAT repeat protein
MQLDPIEELEDALTDGLEPSVEVLERFTDLVGDPAARFTALWGKLSPEQRGRLLAQFGEAAEENLVLDFEPIYRLALADPDAVVRELGIRLAAEEAPPDLFDLYLDAARSDPDPNIRAAALEGLSAYTLAAQTEDWPAERQDRLEDVLVDAIHAPSADDASRRAALLSLAYLTTPRSEREIRQAHLQPDLRDTAIEAMGRNCQEIWIPDLATELEADDADLRMLAAQAAGELEDERLVSDLVARLEDRDEDVRLAAVDALGLIGGDDAKVALSNLLQSRDDELRDAARDALEILLAGDNPLSDLAT